MTEPKPKSVTERVRLALGLTVDTFADELGLDRNSVARACNSNDAGEAMLWAMYDLTTKRMAALLAAREDLQRRMRPLQQARAVRVAGSGVARAPRVHFSQRRRREQEPL